MENEHDVMEAPAKRSGPVGNSPDLSNEIARAVDREPGDRVKVRRVSGTTYRCNWFTPEQCGKREGLFIESFRIRASRFLRAIKVNGKLVIEDLTLDTARNN